MSVSIISPIYNTGSLLVRFLDCIFGQTMQDFEVILVNDGSTDNSGEICEAFAKKDSRVKVIHQQNKGVSAARNAGMDIASGEYIAFLDSDDEILPNMLEDLMKAAQRNTPDVVLCDLNMNGNSIKCDLQPQHLYNKNEIFEDILPRFTYGNAIAEFCPVTKLYKRELLASHNIRWNENIVFQEDLMFTVEVLACAESLEYVPGAYYNYIQSAGGLCSSYRENAGQKFIYARHEFDKLINQYKMINLNITQFNIAFLYNITYYIYRTCHYVKSLKHRNQLIYTTLTDNLAIGICNSLANSATSFDRRIASAIAKGKMRKAVWLINFVHSGKAAKLQNIVSKFRR